jgi:hypothetical protein
MHPAIIKQLVADHIQEMRATVSQEQRARHARRARRQAVPTGPRPSASRALGAGHPRREGGWPPAVTERPSTPPPLVLASSRSGDGNDIAQPGTADRTS